MRNALNSLAAAVALGLLVGTAHAAESPVGETPHYPLLHPKHVHWSFAGPFGHFEPQQLQRGFQVYREVCASCHSLNMIAFRNMASENGPHFSEEQARALAAEYEITDGPDANGEMFQRPAASPIISRARSPMRPPRGRPTTAPIRPDLSLIAKSRAVSSGFPGFIFDAFTQYRRAGRTTSIRF
jgi:cytochrome c1